MAEQALVKNAADESQVKEASVKAKTARDIELEDLRFVLKHPQGRRVLWKLLEFCGCFKSSWDASAKIHFNEGQRNVGLKLTAEISEANQEAYFQMMKEAKGDK